MPSRPGRPVLTVDTAAASGFTYIQIDSPRGRGEMERRWEKRWIHCDLCQILAAVLIVAGITMVIVGVAYALRSNEQNA